MFYHKSARAPLTIPDILNFICFKQQLRQVICHVSYLISQILPVQASQHYSQLVNFFVE